MVAIGTVARYFNRYQDEVEFASSNGFQLMQVWYDNKGIYLHKDDQDFIETIKKYNFPTIIHAVLNIDEFDEHIPKLNEILNTLNHKELIIHPVCEEVNEKTLDELIIKIEYTLEFLTPKGITVYLENNSKKTPIFTDTYEIKKVFSRFPHLEFVLDIAHIDSLDHLKDMVQIKKPKFLHIADKNYNVLHEHLPLGHGEIDYPYIFKHVLADFDGKIILEVTNPNEEIIKSKKIIEDLMIKNR